MSVASGVLDLVGAPKLVATGTNGLILATSSPTSSVQIFGGITDSASAGGKVQVYGATHATYPGWVNINAGNNASSVISLTNASATGYIRFTDSTGATKWKIDGAAGHLASSDSTISLILGAASKDTQPGTTLAYIAADANTYNALNVVSYGATAQCAGNDWYKTRAATPVATSGAVSSGDRIANWRFFASDGTNYDAIAQMLVEVDGTPSAGTDSPGRFVFLTSPDGSSTPAEAVRIDSAKNLKLSGRLVETLTATDVDAQNNTLTVAQITAGIIVHTSVTGAGTITVDTAANIIAGSSGVGALTVDGQCIQCYYINDGTQTLTFGGSPTGITYADTGQTIGADESAVVIFRRTGAAAVTVYCVGA